MAEWKVGFPVDFTENGDKTRDAIQKFINEFQGVYRYLNELKEELSKVSYPIWSLKLLKGVNEFTLPPGGVWTAYVATENENAWHGTDEIDLYEVNYVLTVPGGWTIKRYELVSATGNQGFMNKALLVTALKTRP